MSWPNWPVQQASMATNMSVMPPGMQYTPEQWAQMQHQNWQQWAQWQQQYQQWHQQYGAEYQKSIGAMGVPQPVLPVIPSIEGPPPLPTETKPPLPPEEPPFEPTQTTSNISYTTAPPNVGYSTGTVSSVNNYSAPQQQMHHRQNWNQNKRPFNEGTDFEQNKRHMVEKPPNQWNQNQWGNRPDMSQAPPNFTPGTKQLPPKPVNIEELTDAEKKFDKEFAAWEAQFNKWKQQNANHPDKSQYREYEKKWESWRNSLLERREQMRRKRLNLLSTRSNGTPLPVCNPALDNQLFNKPPPHIKSNSASNDAPLSFKPPQEFPGEILEKKDDFLGSSSTGGIPGLDLVTEGELEEESQAKSKSDVIILDREDVSPQKAEPDFDAISKGINSILGDQKLLRMLSMVTQNQSISSASTSCNKINYSQEIPQNNEHSSQSFDDKSTQGGGESCISREIVNNFDDQTRSSFTLASNEHYDRNSSFHEARTTNGDNRNSFAGSFNQDYEERYKSKENRDDNFIQGKSFNRSNSFAKGGNIGPSKHFNRNDNFSSNLNVPYNTVNYENSCNKSDNNLGGNNNYKQDDDYYGNQLESYQEDDYDELEDFDKYHKWFNEEQQHLPDENQHENFEEDTPEDNEEIFEPMSVIDYDHKPIKKSDEVDILLEPIHMFDYRHKPLNRIPIPQRPLWLNDSVRNMREFDPLVIPLDRTFMPPRFQPDTLRRPRDISRRDRFEEGRARDRNRFFPMEQRKIDKFASKGRNYDIKERETDTKLDLEDLSDEDMIWDETKSPRKDINNSSNNTEKNENTEFYNSTMIEDILHAPGRYKRAPKIVIILRGPPGSGKTYLAKLIKDKELEFGGSAPRILSLDDYFMVEHEKEVVEDGKVTKVKEMVYEYEKEMEETYRQSFLKSFRKTITDGYFPFIIVDNVNDKVKHFGEMWSFAKRNGFQVYVCQLDLDPQVCINRNIHGRTAKEIEDCVAGWDPTPIHHPSLDATSLLQATNIQEVEMEEINSEESDKEDEEEAVEPSSMESASPSEHLAPWRNISNWRMNSGHRLDLENRERSGFAGRTWNNKNNKLR